MTNAEFEVWFAGLDGDDETAQATALTLVGIETATREVGA